MSSQQFLTIDPEHMVRLVYCDDVTLAWMQAQVDGPVQMLSLPDLGLQAFAHEEGKLVGLPVNVLATDIWRSSFFTVEYAPDPTDFLVGTVVFTGGVDEDGNTIGLTKDQTGEIINLCTTRLHFIFHPET